MKLFYCVSREPGKMPPQRTRSKWIGCVQRCEWLFKPLGIDWNNSAGDVVK